MTIPLRKHLSPATSNAEVKYELQRQILKLLSLVLTSIYDQLGLETNLGRNFTGFDIDNNNYVCVVGSDFGKVYLKISTY
jgi:putative ABC transport system permease protein